MPTNCLILITKTLPNWAIPVIKFFQNPTSRQSWTNMSTTANTWIIRTRLGGGTEDNLEFPSEKKKKKKRLILQLRSV